MSNISINGKPLDDVDLFIFDKDGTLVDIHHYWCAMIRMRSEYLSEKYANGDIDVRNDLMNSMGIDLGLNKMKPEGPVGLRPRTFIIETAYKTLLKYSKVDKQDVADAFDYVDELSKKRIDEIVKPLPAVPQILIKLRKNGIKMAIATTDITKRAELVLSVLGIAEYFEIIAGADLVKKSKPSRDLVDYITDKTGTENCRVIVVGDSMVDLDMAKNAGTKFLGVRTGLYNDEFIKKSEILVDDLTCIEVGK
ncbi:MAG: HAD family hydrolase [archaeon]|nr:HAD family hydrolase [Candidatus Micrarchaeota archaeon]MBU1887025.1 HAD family hydrolase [Candidatus Micrarchaeota archaeon]